MPQPEWGAGGRWGPAFPLLTRLYSAHPPPRAGRDESCLITQLAAPWPPTAHSPPPAAWLCQELTGAASKHPWAPAQGSAQPSGPCLRPRGGARVGTGEGPAGMRRQQPGQLGAGAGRRRGGEGPSSSRLEAPRHSDVSHPCLVSASASWSPERFPLYLGVSGIRLLVSPNRAFSRGGAGRELGAEGSG